MLGFLDTFTVASLVSLVVAVIALLGVSIYLAYRNSGLEEELEGCQREAFDVHSALEETKRQVGALTFELEETVKENEKANSKNAVLKREMEENEAYQEALRDDLKEMEKQIKDIEKKCDERINNAKKDVKNLDLRCRQMERKADWLKAQLKDIKEHGVNKLHLSVSKKKLQDANDGKLKQILLDKKPYWDSRLLKDKESEKIKKFHVVELRNGVNAPDRALFELQYIHSIGSDKKRKYEVALGERLN